MPIVGDVNHPVWNVFVCYQYYEYYKAVLRDPFKFDIFHYNSIYLEQTSSQMQLNTRIVPGMILNNMRYVIGSLVHLNRKIEDFSITVVG